MDGAGKRNLWELTYGQRLRYAGAIVAMGAGFLLVLQTPLVAKGIVDSLAAGERVGAARLWRAAGLIVALFAGGSLLQYLRGRWAAIASEGIVRGLRDRLYSHLERLPCRYHDGADTGDLVQRCTSDVETVRTFLAAQVVEIGRALLLLALVIPLMVGLDGAMTAVALSLFPLILGSAIFFFRRIKALFLQVDEAEGAMTAVLQENLTGIRVVRAFARQEHECAKFAASNGAHRDLHRRLFRLLAGYWGLSDFVCVAQIGIALLVGAHWAIAGRISVGTLYAFLAYLALVIWPVRHLGRVLTDAGKAIVALGRLSAILGEPAEREGGERPAALEGAIEVRGLTFAFDDAKPALRGFDLSVRPGETVALLGAPGAGKSTFIQLLLRLYDYDAGSFLLDGCELDTLDRRFVREQVGAVLQEPFLYSRTVGANVRLGRSGASHDEVVASASDACIHGAIEEFDQGYETLVGERGVTLSGGQRQRLALARALLKDPPILVLDDALSAVDTQTEAAILDALRARRGRRTTIVIAHRLSSVADADRVLFLEEGRVVQAGPPAELTRVEGPYRRLWQIQCALEEDLVGDRP